MIDHHRLHSCVAPAHGFAYVELLVAIAVLTVCLAPALESLHSSLALPGLQEAMTIDQYALVAKTEAVLAEGFTDLDAAAAAAGGPSTPSSYSDVFTTSDGRQLSRNVYLWPLDGDNADLDAAPFTGTDAGILYVKVAIVGTALLHETLVVREAATP